MPQSFCQIYIHAIFSTKGRKKWLDTAIRSRIHAYLATPARDCGCPYVVVGGVEDHVHVLADIGKAISPTSFIGKIKQESSKFVKTLNPGYGEFYWQNGYAMFFVSPKNIKDAKAYIENQVEHHKKHTFQE